MACSQQQQQQPLIGYVMSCDGQMYAVNLPQTYAVIPTHSVSMLSFLRASVYVSYFGYCQLFEI